MHWTRKRLEDTARTCLQGVKLITVANREPYIHARRGDGIHVIHPAGGLTTAVNPVMQACGGVWIGHGSGTADRETADERGRLAVPPENPTYTLRRMWLTDEEFAGFYAGFANDALWPLCHVAYTQPRFDLSDFRVYRDVNRRYADAVLDEIGSDRALVWIHDYHFALLPRMLRQVRPDLTIVQFWHIPWPAREILRICPWKEELLDGLLGNDLLSFHIRYHCLNFLDAADRMLESRVDMEHFTVTRRGYHTQIRPHPISIATPEPSRPTPAGNPSPAATRARLGLGPQERVLVGLDRVDYTKGIPERLRAVDRLLTAHPEHTGKIRMVQVGSPSRQHVPAYRRLAETVSTLVRDINARHSRDGWSPILYLPDHQEPEQVAEFYRAADVCVVSSLHDGMNLVAKEFVMAREDLRGVLVLSQFTGSAREMPDAVVINPYATDDFAEALHQALEMPAAEQERRLTRLRRHIEEHNVYRWAGKLLIEAVGIMERRR